MNSPTYQVRRATVDDLPNLRPLWEKSKMPLADLEPRLTEFQVAVEADGAIIGALALKIVGNAGILHNETYEDFSQADELREAFWQRIRNLAANHALTRLWTREQAPFWRRTGFVIAEEEVLGRLPNECKLENPSGWSTLQLREETEDGQSPEDQAIKLYMASQREETEKLLQRARTMKKLATLVAFLLVGGICLAILYILRRNPHILSHGQ